MTLSDLQDVLIDGGIASNSLLVYDNVQKKWIPKTLSETFDLTIAEMVGATATTDGSAGYVPAPQAGEQGLYLRGDATWANPTAALEAVVNTLAGSVNAVTTDVLNLRGTDTGNITIREIAEEEVAKVVAQAPGSFDTLKEIADWISNHEDALDLAELQDDVAQLKSTVNGMPAEVDDQTGEIITPEVPGLVTRVGTLETGLQAANTNISSLQTITNTLNNDVAGLKTRMDDVEDELENVDQRLRWQNLINEG